MKGHESKGSTDLWIFNLILSRKALKDLGRCYSSKRLPSRNLSFFSYPINTGGRAPVLIWWKTDSNGIRFVKIPVTWNCLDSLNLSPPLPLQRSIYEKKHHLRLCICLPESLCPAALRQGHVKRGQNEKSPIYEINLEMSLLLLSETVSECIYSWWC